MTGPRTPCGVIGCHRSKAGRWVWWLCRDHYAMVPRWVRARHRRLKAWFRRHGQIEVGERSWRTTSERATQVMDAAGREIIRAAQRRAAGL